MSARRHAAIAASLALFAPACSLLGLQNFEVPPCQADSDCIPLNEAEGIDHTTACELYQCVEGSDSGGCVLRERDNDEDSFVNAMCGGDDCDDEDVFAYPGAPVVGTPQITGVDTPNWIRWAPAPDGALALTYPIATNDAAFDTLGIGLASRDPSVPPTEVGGATDVDFGSMNVAIEVGCLSTGVQPLVFPTQAITPVAGLCATHEECQDESFCNGFEICQPDSDMAVWIDTNGCRAPPSRDPCAGQQCDEASEACLIVNPIPNCLVGEVAAAHVREDDWMAAEINTNGCSVGRLVVGWMSTAPFTANIGEPGPNLLLRGGMGRAPSFTGIDLGGSPLCTGAKRGAGEPVGASAVNLAVLPADPANDRLRPQALVAWQAAPVCRGSGRCTDEVGGSGSVQIEVIGAWFEQAPGMADPARWVAVSGSGLTQSLGSETADVAPPSIVAVDGADAGYVIAYGASTGGIITRFVPAFSDPDRAPTASDFGVLTTSPYPTRLATGTAQDRTRPTPNLTSLGTEVQVAGGGSASAMVDHVHVAFAPADGDSAAGMLVWLEGTDVWARTLTLTPSAGTLVAGDAVQLSTAGAAAPDLSYIGSGLCGPDCGGWAATWVEGGEGRLARFDADAARLDTAPFALLAGTTRVRAFETSGAMRLAWHDEAQTSVVVSNGQCPPPEE